GEAAPSAGPTSGPLRAAAARRTSSSVTRPWGPVPWICVMSTPSSRARRRVEGAAGTRLRREKAGTGAALPATPLASAPAAFSASACPSPPDSSAITRSTSPTGTVSPSRHRISVTRPAAGAGSSTTALSVCISTTGWSNSTRSPTRTSQRTTSASAIPSPTSGSLKSTATECPPFRKAMLVHLYAPAERRRITDPLACPPDRKFPGGASSKADHLLHRFGNPAHVGTEGILQGKVRHRNIVPRHPGYGRFQPEEGPLVDERRQLRTHPGRPGSLVDDHGAAGLFDGFDDGVLIDRIQGAQVDHFAADPVLLPGLRRLLGHRHHRSPGQYRHVFPLPHLSGLPDGNLVPPLGHLLPMGAVQLHRFQEDDRIGILDGGQQQPLGIVRSGRSHHLQSRGVHKQSLRRIGVEFRGADPPAVGSADHEGKGKGPLIPRPKPEIGRASV